MKKKLVKIEEIRMDERVYPRMRPDWMVIAQYADAMKAGADFPPVQLGRFKGDYYLIDGRHRIEAAKRCNGSDVPAQIEDYTSIKKMYLDAVKANMGHGKPFYVHERRRIIHKLSEMGLTRNEISTLVRIPVGKLRLGQV
jgi:hypothetical protein